MSPLLPLFASLPPEARLLLLAADAQPDTESAARLLAAVAAGVDWDRFLKTAQAHGVHPLVARNLLACARPRLTAEAERVLQGWLHRTVARNLHLLRGLGEVLARFEQARIPVVCLKGPALAVSVFGGLEARTSNDLDVIVPPDHVERAAKVLEAAGFAGAFADLTPGERRFFRPGLGLALTFLRPRDRLQLELHSALAAEGPPPDSKFWSRCQKVTVEGVALPVMPPEEVVCYAGRHAAAHGWNVLRHVCDFREAGRCLTPASWEAVASVARQTGQTVALGVSALLVRDYFGVAVPAPVQSFLASGWRVPWLARQASRHLRDNLRCGTFRAPPSSLAWVLQPGVRPWLRRLELAIRPCLLERQWVRLPRPLWPLYYLVRPVRLGLKYAGLGRRHPQRDTNADSNELSR